MLKNNNNNTRANDDGDDDDPPLLEEEPMDDLGAALLNRARFRTLDTYKEKGPRVERESARSLLGGFLPFLFAPHARCLAK